jgi:hypothetical protein
MGKYLAGRDVVTGCNFTADATTEAPFPKTRTAHAEGSAPDVTRRWPRR